MELANLVSSVGFPIVAYFVLYGQLSEYRKAIEQNTKELTKIYEQISMRLGSEENGEDRQDV